MLVFLVNESLYINQELRKQIIDKTNIKLFLIERKRRRKNKNLLGKVTFLSYQKPFFGGPRRQSTIKQKAVKLCIENIPEGRETHLKNQLKSLNIQTKEYLKILNNLEKDIATLKQGLKKCV